jgi:hypothetical protein
MVKVKGHLIPGTDIIKGRTLPDTVFFFILPN